MYIHTYICMHAYELIKNRRRMSCMITRDKALRRVAWLSRHLTIVSGSNDRVWLSRHQGRILVEVKASWESKAVSNRCWDKVLVVMGASLMGKVHCRWSNMSLVSALLQFHLFTTLMYHLVNHPSPSSTWRCSLKVMVCSQSRRQPLEMPKATAPVPPLSAGASCKDSTGVCGKLASPGTWMRTLSGQHPAQGPSWLVGFNCSDGSTLRVGLAFAASARRNARSPSSVCSTSAGSPSSLSSTSVWDPLATIVKPCGYTDYLSQRWLRVVCPRDPTKELFTHA